MALALAALCLLPALWPLPAARSAPRDRQAEGTQVRENFHPGGQLKTRWHVLRTAEGDVVRNGPYRRYHPGGRAELEGYYRRGEPVGVWSWWAPNGQLLWRLRYLSTGPVRVYGRETESPDTVFRNPSGIKVAAGQLKYDKAHGVWRYWYHDGAPRAEGRFLTGVPDGQWTYLYRDGQIERVIGYRLGIPHGLHLEAYENGVHKLEGRMDQGLRSGTWTRRYRDGRTKAQGPYRQDQRHGEWRFWNEQGELVRRVRYDQGEVAEELPLPPEDEPPAPVIPEGSDLPFRPRLYDDQGREVLPRFHDAGSQR